MSCVSEGGRGGGGEGGKGGGKEREGERERASQSSRLACGRGADASLPGFSLIRTTKNRSLFPKSPKCPCRNASTESNSVSTPVSSSTSRAAPSGRCSPASMRPVKCERGVGGEEDVMIHSLIMLTEGGGEGFLLFSSPLRVVEGQESHFPSRGRRGDDGVEVEWVGLLTAKICKILRI